MEFEYAPGQIFTEICLKAGESLNTVTPLYYCMEGENTSGERDVPSQERSATLIRVPPFYRNRFKP